MRLCRLFRRASNACRFLAFTRLKFCRERLTKHFSSSWINASIIFTSLERWWAEQRRWLKGYEWATWNSELIRPYCSITKWSWIGTSRKPEWYLRIECWHWRSLRPAITLATIHGSRTACSRRRATRICLRKAWRRLWTSSRIRLWRNADRY